MATEKGKRREDERTYWDEHGIDEEPGQEANVHVKMRLSVMLSLRLDEDHADKLKHLAEQKDRGITTLARRLLQQAIDAEFFIKAMHEPYVQNAMKDMFDNGKIPPGEGQPTYFILAKTDLDNMNELLKETWLKMMRRALDTPITPDQPVYKQIKEMEDARS